MIEERRRKLRLPLAVENHLGKVYTQADWAMIDSADAEGTIRQADYTEQEIWSAYHRGILNKKVADDGQLSYVIAPFEVRMECMIQCEPQVWESIQGEDWEALRDVMMDPEHWMKERIEAVASGNGRPSIVKPLEEAEKLLENAEGHFTSCRCNCQAYIRGCDRDKTRSCIHVEPPDIRPNSPLDRGLCEEITQEEAIEALRYTDQQGLVHMIEPNGMCNCCRCCCYTLRNMEQYPIKDQVFLRPYRAKVIEEQCIGCGACARKCMFDALHMAGSKMNVDWEQCIGCGVCRRNCTKNAIVMIEI